MRLQKNIMVNIHAVGGFSEVGKNMVLVELEDDAFIIDEGFYLPAVISIQEQDRVLTQKRLRALKAIPDDSVIKRVRDKVCAQFISHAHLDHVGAVPFISDAYNAPIYATPFTINFLKTILKDNDLVLRNKLCAIKPNTTFYIKGKNRKYQIDFIHMTHSTVQSSMVAIHTDEGIVLFSGDFKLDDTPIVGPKPNYKRLKELGKKGVLAFIVNSLYSGSQKRTPSESYARKLLEDTMDQIENRHEGIIVTTFASHIARLKSIQDIGRKLGREVVFLGRSMDKYITAAKDAGIASFFDKSSISKYRRQVERTLHKVEKNRNKFVLVCTGHQGEPGSILERISRHQLPFRITSKDNIVFSSSVIPTDLNREQFAKMEKSLKKSRPKIFRDVHVSGHAREDDLIDTIKMVNPKHLIPWHGDEEKTAPMMAIAKRLGYAAGKQAHLMQDGEVLKV